ncbi:hypothetical protein K439DRAFT_1513517 [Ramaria rubella]|nr:hypothetical protein K439DRAFT_1513517 [Ramaria rubella]
MYAFAGCVGFWIHPEWELVEVVLKLVALDGDHSGAVTGKLLLNALRSRGASQKLITNGTNNASSNGVMNHAISKQAQKAHGLHLDPDTMGVRAIFHALGVAPSPEDHDLYENACEHPLAYNPTTDPSVVKKSKLHAQETKADAEGHSDMIIDLSDASDGEWDVSDKENAYENSLAVKKSKSFKLQKPLSVPKKAINQWIDQLDQHVTGRKKKEAACKQNDWFLTPKDWDMLDRLCGILKATLELSKTCVPTICKVLPLYKLVQEHLEAALRNLEMEHDICGIAVAVQAGLDKLEKYLDHAMDNDYVLLGAGALTPRRNVDLLLILYAQYSILLSVLPISRIWKDGNQPWHNVLAHFSTTSMTLMPKWMTHQSLNLQPQQTQSMNNHLFLLKLSAAHSQRCPKVVQMNLKHTLVEHIHVSVRTYLHGTRTIVPTSLLSPGFPRTFYAFLDGKATISNTRSSLKAHTASKTIIAKEHFQKGFWGGGIEYLEGVNIQS